MKMSYFDDSDTLYIELKSSNVFETKVLDENTFIDLDEAGNIIAITMEHASHRTDIHNLTLTGLAA